MKWSRTALAAAVLVSAIPAWLNASGLAACRTFTLRTSIATGVERAGVDASRVKIVHARPGLIQQVVWWPGYYRPATQTDSVKELVFTFFEGDLFQISARSERQGEKV